MLEKHYQGIACLELVRIEEFIPSFLGEVGHPAADRCALARAFIAKAVCNLPTTVQMIDRLRCDTALRRICGWERKSQIPSEAIVSRAFKEFADRALPTLVHETLIVSSHEKRLVGHISEDSTAIEAREKSLKKPKDLTVPSPIKKKRGRKKKGEEQPSPHPTRIERQLEMSLEDRLSDLPTACDRGTKRNSKGYQEKWKGYKLHIDTAVGPHEAQRYKERSAAEYPY